MADPFAAAFGHLREDNKADNNAEEDNQYHRRHPYPSLLRGKRDPAI